MRGADDAVLHWPCQLLWAAWRHLNSEITQQFLELKRKIEQQMGTKMGDKCVKMRSGVESMMNSEKGWSKLKNTKFRVK